MKLKTLKKLQLLTVLIFVLTILIMIIGLVLIGFSKHSTFNLNSKLILIKSNGFTLLNHISVSYVLSKYVDFIDKDNNYNENYYNLKQLQIGIIFCVILVPILGIITLSLTFFIIGLKMKIKNNNFWDAIQNCEIINNYYIH